MVKGELHRPRQVNGKVPAALEAVCLKAMALAPSDRYASARGLADDIEHWLADEPVSAAEESLGERVARWRRRHQALARAAALTLMIVSAVSVVSAIFIENARVAAEGQRKLAEDARDNERKATKSAKRSADVARANGNLAREQLYLTRQQLAQAAWQEGDINRLKDLLARQIPEPKQQDLRGFEWRYLDALCATERLVYRGHRLRVNTVACSPKGRMAASGGFDGEVQVWEISSGATLWQKHVNDMSVNCLAFSPNGELLACAGNLGHLSLYDAASGAEIQRLEGHGVQVFWVAFSPDGKVLASAGADNTARLWEVSGGRPLQVCRGHQNMVWSVSFHPQGKLLASSSSDGSVRTWNVDTGEQLQEFGGHAGFVTGVAFSPSGTRLASVSRTPLFSSESGEVKLWNLTEGREEATLRGHSGSVNFLAFSPDGMFLSTVGDDRTVKLWNVLSKQVAAVHKGHTAPVNGVAFSPDGSFLYSAGTDATVRVWDAFKAPGRCELPVSNQSSIKSVCSASGRFLAVSSDARVELFETSTWRKVAELADEFTPVTETPEGYSSAGAAVAFSPDEQRVVGLRAIRHSLALTGEAVVWNVATRQPLRRLTGHGATISSLDWSPNGAWIVSASHDKTIKTWDAETGAELATFEGHQFPIYDVRISPDGLQVASAAAAPENRVFDQKPSPRLGEVMVWDVKSRKPVLTLSTGEGPAFCLAFSPTQKLLAVGGADGVARLWSHETGELHTECEGHTAAIHGVSFSGDGRRLATGSDDASVRLWDVGTGQELLVLRGHAKSVACVEFAKHGDRLVSSAASFVAPGELILWEAGSHDESTSDEGDVSRQVFLHERLLQQARTAKDTFGAVYHARALRGAAARDVKVARNCADAMVGFHEFALAEEFCRAAIALAPGDAELQHRLGHTFFLRGDLAGAAVVYRKLTEVVPDFADGFYSLGNTLRDMGDTEGAIEAFRHAVRLKPEFAEAHCNLGRVLQHCGLFVESLQEFRRGHELGLKRQSGRVRGLTVTNPSAWPYPSGEWVAQAEQFVKFDEKWAAVQRGEATPADATERIWLAQVCAFKHLNLAAAEFYKEAFEAQPSLAEEPTNGIRYSAGCSAALAGTGQSPDAESLDAAVRADWRKRALDWLLADLDVWQTRLGNVTPQVRASIAMTLEHWLRDPDLAGIRDADALAKLPDDEREALTEFWADVAALAKQAEAPCGEQGEP